MAAGFVGAPPPGDAPAPGHEQDRAILELSNVDVTPPGAPRPVITGVSLTLLRGEIGVLLGGNGAGKSTLLRAAAGMWPVSHGIVRSPSEGVLDPRMAALLLEDPAAQFVAPTAAGEIAFTLENAGLEGDEIERRVARALEESGLAPCAARDPLTLSPGEQERLLLAAALALRPRLLLLDDPFLFLGPGEGWAVWSRLRAALADGTVDAVLLAAHDGELAAEGDKAGVLDQGRLLAWGSPHDVLAGELPAAVEPPLARRLECALRERGWALAGAGYSAEAMARRLLGRTAR